MKRRKLRTQLLSDCIVYVHAHTQLLASETLRKEGGGTWRWNEHRDEMKKERKREGERELSDRLRPVVVETS